MYRQFSRLSLSSLSLILVIIIIIHKFSIALFPRWASSVRLHKDWGDCESGVHFQNTFLPFQREYYSIYPPNHSPSLPISVIWFSRLTGSWIPPPPPPPPPPNFSFIGSTCQLYLCAKAACKTKTTPHPLLFLSICWANPVQLTGRLNSQLPILPPFIPLPPSPTPLTPTLQFYFQAPIPRLNWVK